MSNRFQRTKINTSFSSWSELLTGVPQGSVLGPLLFNIYLNDLFWFSEKTEPCNFADDTTFYSCNKSLQKVVENLEHDSSIALKWFQDNYMKLNSDKCHLLIAGSKHVEQSVTIWGRDFLETNEQRLLGIHIGKN